MAATELGDAARIPVLIGVGQINDRAKSGAGGLDSLGLMIAAARAAGDDAVGDAGGDILALTDWLGVVNQISFPALTGTLIDGLRDALRITPTCARETPSPTGDSPILLINEAANAIGAGTAQVALIVGAEALRTAALRKKEAAMAAADEPQAGEAKQGPYPKRTPISPEPRHLYGMMTPTDVYPLFENAARVAYGQTLAEAQAESGAIWAGMSQVAARNDSAWIRRPMTAESIITPGPDNRPIAFPYTKFQVANAAVNQGAAVIVTSLAIARKAGIADQHIIYIGKGAAAHEAEDPLMRPDFASSASMELSLTKALEFNAVTIDQIDHLELYSCFPIVPKMARRVLGIPANRQITQFGGLTFGGGPIGNYMTHAAASMVEALRKSGSNGLLFANGGYATHNHTLLLTKIPQPAGTFPQDFDVQAEADARRGAVPAMLLNHQGPARLESYTILYDRNGDPRHGVVVARIDGARRCLALVPASDTSALARLETGDSTLVGAPGSVAKSGDHLIWTFD